MATKKEADQAVAPVKAVFVLCTGSFDGVRRIQAGAVVEGVPEAVASAHKAWLDVAPEAVSHAKGNGAAIAKYEAG